MGTNINELDRRGISKNIKGNIDQLNGSDIKYVKEIDTNLNEDYMDNILIQNHNKINISKLKNEIVENDISNHDTDDKHLGLVKDKTIKKRENEFQKKKYNYIMSPERKDPFSEKSPSPENRTYTDIMMEINKEGHKSKIMNKNVMNDNKKRKIRWGDVEEKEINENKKMDNKNNETNENNKKETIKSKWDYIQDEKITNFGNLPTPAPNKWVDTPFVLNEGNLKKKKISRWDKVGNAENIVNDLKTPKITSLDISSTNNINTPYVPPNSNMFTPLTPAAPNLQPDIFIKMKIKNEMEMRNRPLTDEDLDELLPSEGYEIVKAPEEYEAIRRNKLKALFKNINTTPMLSNNNTSINEKGLTSNINNNAGIETTENNIVQTPYNMQSTLINTPFYNIPTTSNILKSEEANYLVQNNQFEITNTQLLNELK